MKKMHLSFVLAWGLLGLALALVWLLGRPLSVAHAQDPITRYVAITGIDSGTCTNPYVPCRTVQHAVDQAADGDLIKVASGLYTGINNQGGLAQMVYVDKSVTIRGGYKAPGFADPPNSEANPTTLDAQKQGRVFYVTGDVQPSIERLYITGGDATGLGGAISGSDAGGGLYVVTATATIICNQVLDNTARLGGGLYLSRSDAILVNNTISGSTANMGGGMYLEQASDVTLSGNIITSNTATLIGGGVALSLSNAKVDGNIISENTVDTYGGGGLALSKSDAELVNNIIADNQTPYLGNAVFMLESSSIRILHTTIARNLGGNGIGIFLDGNRNTAVLSNTILVAHDVGVEIRSGSVLTAEGTLWGAGLWVNGIDWSGDGTVLTGTINIWDDPGFVDPDAGDYHIGPGSGALDQGIDAGVISDIDRQPRPYLAPDLGADEYWPAGTLKHVYLPLVLRAGP